LHQVEADRAGRTGEQAAVPPKRRGLLSRLVKGPRSPVQELPREAQPMSQESQTLPTGALVDARGERWRVAESIQHDGCATCRLEGAAASNMGVRRTLLLPFDRPRPVPRAQRWRRVGRRRWMLACRALMASDATGGGLRGAGDARLDLFAYQLEPALACAHGARRLLLADEVGLGKTVQAGLLLADLCARAESARCLVLCPAGLCGQWQHELASRFGLEPAVVDLSTLRGLFRRVSAESVPWDRLPLAIASVDFVKRPEVLQGMARIRWDLLVVDEAHLSALAAERAAAVNWLARRSRRVVLLTATPHPGEEGAFDALCRVGRLPGEGPILMFRRTRAGLGLPAARRVRVLALRLSPAERRLHASLRRYTARVWNTGGGDRRAADARLAMIVLAKRAASGPAPLLASLERRLRSLDRRDEEEAGQLLLPLGEADAEGVDDEPGAILAAPGLESRAAEIEALSSLAELARAAVPFDSKVRALVRLLARVRQPAIVFTEYRDALSRVASQLAPDTEVALIHGGLDRRARGDAVRCFTSGSATVLLATDAAAHGLNLQARCRLVIDLDLPWNPVRLEQRIGRVDRIGQRKVVHAIHLVGRGTADAVVLDRLAARTRCARRSLGDAAADPVGSGAEMAIAEAVFNTRAANGLDLASSRPGAPRQEATPEPADTFRRADFSAEAGNEAARLTRLRQLRRRGRIVLQDVVAQLDAASPWWTRLAFHGTGAPRVLVLFRADIVNGRGLLVEQVLIPLEACVGRASASPGSIPLTRLEAAALEAALLTLERLSAGILPGLEAERARETALADVVDAVPVVAVQAGLFDRRALRRAEAAREERAGLRDETGRHVEHLRQAARLLLAEPPRLVLAALVRGA
jgi:superfamily II DNA or RNA helicase